MSEPTMSTQSQPNPTPAGEVHLDHFKKHIRQAIGVFVALMVLTLVTVGASYIQLGRTGNIILAMIIATFKASLVAAIFMHLVAEKQMVIRVLIFTAIFFAALFALTLFSLSDIVNPSNVP